MFEPCPCGQKTSYLKCCAQLHQGLREAEKAEQLMRARYSAFVKRDENYLFKSWSFETRPPKIHISQDQKWTKLEVINASSGVNDEAFVTFKATYHRQGQEGCLFEKSRFRRENGLWVYVNGDIF